MEFTLEYYGPAYGYELLTLNAMSLQVGADGSSSVFWELLVNGEMTDTGIDTTCPSDGDSIQWNYLPYSAARHSNTRYEALCGTGSR